MHVFFSNIYFKHIFHIYKYYICIYNTYIYIFSRTSQDPLPNKLYKAKVIPISKSEKVTTNKTTDKFFQRKQTQKLK